VDSVFDEHLQRLQSALTEVQEVLRTFGEDHWSAWFAPCETALEASDAQAFDEVLRAFGGMGSFNDLVLRHPSMGLRSSVETALQSTGWTDEEQAANAHIGELGSTIWAEATALKKELRQS
jgi:hypothetical protein